jgi:competence protein ComEA
MKVFKTLFASLLLSMMLVGGALASDKVNINTANAAELDRVLVNVGASKAQAIVAYRKDNGAFKSLEQLAMVKGIGLKTVEKNRDRIELGGVNVARKAATPAASIRSKAAR